MYILVIYDITEDDVRNKVAETLAAYGLHRIQKSAFLGRLPSALLKDLEARLRRVSRGANANIQIFKVDKRAIEGRITIGMPETPQRNVELL